MRSSSIVSFVLATALLAACRAPRPHDADELDVVVYGGTAAGVIAAVQLATLGRSVVLLEATERIGGLTTCGLGATDVGSEGAIGGLAREFYRRVAAHYTDDAAWTHERRADFAGRGHEPGADTAWTFEPKVALAILTRMLDEAQVRVVAGAALADAGAVERDADRIRAIRTHDGRRWPARVFIDASYEGDLLAQAGVSYRVGREGNAEHGETLNGVQTRNATKHQFTHRVDPFVVPGRPESGLLRWISAAPPGEDGSADHRVQAYCFRLCTTDVETNRLPWPRPAGYDERDYELLLRNFEAGDLRAPWHRVAMPNRKTDTNNNFAFSTDVIGLSWDWPNGDRATRARLFAEHLRYTQGLLWTLANHPRVPEAVRAEFTRFGLCRDEFVETGGWPPQLYVREARRMVGEVVMSERHCRGELRVEDPVGLGSYGMDSHNVQRWVDAAGVVRNEGDIQVHGFAPYGIAYRAIVPKRAECTNLLVPVAVSATHIAYGSIRMEPVFMVLAQSAAIAADLALGSGTRPPRAVQDLPWAELSARLLAAGQRLAAPARTGTPRGLDPARQEGVVVDDVDAFLEGPWSKGDSVTPFLGSGYVHDGDANKGACRARFDLRAARRGRVHVELAWQAHANRASNTLVELRVRGETITRRIDQRSPPAGGALFEDLFEIELDEGEIVTLSVGNAGTTGHVVVDAARLRSPR